MDPIIETDDILPNKAQTKKRDQPPKKLTNGDALYYINNTIQGKMILLTSVPELRERLEEVKKTRKFHFDFFFNFFLSESMYRSALKITAFRQPKQLGYD
jgi:hypothetical protein